MGVSTLSMHHPCFSSCIILESCSHLLLAHILFLFYFYISSFLEIIERQYMYKLLFQLLLLSFINSTGVVWFINNTIKIQIVNLNKIFNVFIERNSPKIITKTPTNRHCWIIFCPGIQN